ncbi:MAG: MCE family protein [Taibaiella sp.]|nr:MCE family protein [Taibaiella sp.]
MKTTASQKIKIGVFTIAGLLVLAAGVFLIGKKKNMFSDTFTIFGTFRNVGGLQIGNNIRFLGINIGTIESIKIINDTMARVNMRLQSSVKKYIETSDVATIGSDGLMGDKLININASGEEGGELMKNGGRIATEDPIEMDKIMKKLNGVVENASDLTGSLAGIFSNINNGKGSIGRLIKSDALAKNLENTVSSANQTMKTIKAGGEGFSDNMQALKHNFLLRGYFKKQEKAKEEKLKKQQEQQDQTPTPETNTKKKK